MGGGHLSFKKAQELSDLKYRSTMLEHQVGGKQEAFLQRRRGVWAVGWKNNRPRDMFILLLDANKAVNSIITSKAAIPVPESAAA